MDTTNKFPTLWIVMLGTMIALGPLSIDMYLPALPSMAKSFGVSTGFVANSVPAYFIGLVVGQLFYGPLSDRIGRVKPIYIGMLLFVCATGVCLYTENVYILFIARTFQALGACVTSVVVKAAIRDVLPPHEMSKALALTTLVMGVAPIFAPSLGALLLIFFDWHMIFWVLLMYGVLNIFLCKFFFTETLPKEKRNHASMKTVIPQYWDLLKDKRFSISAISSGLTMGAMFTYISSASELFMDEYGLVESHFSIVFSLNAFGFIALTQLNQFFTNKFSLVSVVRFGAVVQCLAAVCLMISGLIWGKDTHLVFVVISLFVCISMLGLLQPNLGAITLAYQKHRSGLASAMQGAFMFSVGIFGGSLLNVFPYNTLARLGITMAILTLLANVMIWKINPKLDLSNID